MTRYDSAFGSPVARVLGVGYIQEMVARLTQTPIATHNSSTNATLDDDPITFPLDHNLYVDATHEVVVLNSAYSFSWKLHFFRMLAAILTCLQIVITALNLTSFAAAGPLPTDHIPSYRTFRSSQLSPFSTNIQFQRAYSLLTHSSPRHPAPLQRAILTSPITNPFLLLIHSTFLRSLHRPSNTRHHQRRRRTSHRHRRLSRGQGRHVSHLNVR